MEIWIPEVVLWELAAHVWDSIQETNSSLQRLAGILTKAGLPTVETVSFDSSGAVLENLEDALVNLGEGLEIIECKSADALDALKDQIFAQGPAEKKGKNDDLRTGAADSAWLRSVIRSAEEAGHELVIVSNDPDVSRGLEALGSEDVVVFRTAHDARTELFPYGVAPLGLTYDVLAHLDETLVGGTEETWPGRFPSDVRMIVRDLGYVPVDHQVVGATITELKRIVAADQLSISEDGDRGSIDIDVQASCELLTAATESSLTEAISVPLEIADWVFHYNLWIQIDDAKVVAFGLNDDPWAMHNPATWDEWEEALDECLDSYFDAPEHSKEELRHGGVGRWTVPLHRYSGETVELQAEVTESGWVLEAEAEAGTLKLTCKRGRRRGTWRVVVEEDGVVVGERPKYAISAFLIRLGLQDRRTAPTKGKS